MSDPTYPLYPVAAIISFVLVLIPLPWHLQAWNSGTCLFMIWTALGCLNFFINSIIWHGNFTDWAPVWCDISTRLTIGISVAIPAASLCINRRLYNIASRTTASITTAQKRRFIIVDLIIGLGIPALQMPLQFIVQGHRYDIWEDIGCYPITVNTPPAYPLTFLWPNVIGLTSAVYSVLTLRAFLKRRAEFSKILSNSSVISANRYFRLMLLATLEIFISVPISSYGLYLNATKAPIYSWRGWSDLHFGWYTINTYPAVLWRSNHSIVATLELSRWSPILSAIIFFAFFGFAQEARKNYKVALACVITPLVKVLKGITQRKSAFLPKSATTQTGLLPIYTPKPPMNVRRSSVSLYSDTATLKTQSSRLSFQSPAWKSDLITPPLMT